MFIAELFTNAPIHRTVTSEKNYLEEAKPQLVVFYPGRFQPFHLGHRDVFQSLQNKFGRDHVYIATSNKVDLPKSPFNFTEKVAFMNAAGVPADRIVEVASPYKLPAQYDPANTIFVVVVGAPDADRLNPGSYKKDGQPGYYQNFEGLDKCQTADKHGYVVIANERKKVITLGGKEYDASHGTESRKLWNMVRKKPKLRSEYLLQMFGRDDPELERILNKIPLGEDSNLPVAVDSISPIHGKIEEHIVKVGSKYRLVSKHGNKNLGTYDTRAGAEKRERQVQYFKHANENLNEFAPGGGDDDDYNSEDVLFRLAQMWYTAADEATEQRAEQALAKMGWEIGGLESEEGGAFVMEIGDDEGHSYIAWSAEDLEQGLAEMDKSQPSHGRDGKISHSTYGSRDKGGSTGPERTAKATTADRMMKHAHDVMMKSMSDADKVKKGWRNPNIEEQGVAESLEQIPAILYHATYRPLLKSIKKYGLGGDKAQAKWEDSKPGVVYLALNKDVAESYAETSDVVPDEWLDEIVVLKISTNGLDAAKFHLDTNVLDNEGDTVEYHGVIPVNNIKMIKQGVAEAFDQPYKLKWEKGEHGDYDALATLDDGTFLSIMFNNEFKNNWMVEFYRNNSQEVTGEGDAQRIFATVLMAIGQFIKKKKPVSLFFSAVKEDDPKGSRAKLYNTLVNRYATNLGYSVTTRNDDRGMSFKLTKVKQGVAEAKGELWRVLEPRNIGGHAARYYVVKGQGKDLKIWRSKSGAGDFIKQADAEAKANELNQTVSEAVGGNYLYHATDANGLAGILQSGAIRSAISPQKATLAQTQMPTVSVTRDWGYASGSNAANQMGGVGRDAVLVLDREGIESNFKTLGTSQSEIIQGQTFNPFLTKGGQGRPQATDAFARDMAKKRTMGADKGSKLGGEFEEVVVVPKGSLPIKNALVGFWINPKSKLANDPSIMNDPRRLDMIRPNQFVKAKQAVAEDAAGVGVVKNSKDPRYVMATMGDQNDVTGDTLEKEMRAYGLVGRKISKEKIKEAADILARLYYLKESLK